MGTTRTTTQTHQQSQQNQGSNVANYTDPMMQKFAQGQMSNINNAIQQAQQPVYGQAQVNQYLGGLNDLANSSIKNLQSNLARRGVGQSGQFGQGVTDIDMSRMGQASNFMGQLPFMNRQATMQALPGLFGAAAQQQSVAPKRQDYAGTQSGTGTDINKAKGSWLDTVSQIAGIVGQVGGAAMGMPGLGGMMGGGGGAAPVSWNPMSLGQSSAFNPALNQQAMTPQGMNAGNQMPSWLQGMQPTTQPWYGGQE